MCNQCDLDLDLFFNNKVELKLDLHLSMTMNQFLNVCLKIRFPLSKFSSHNYYLSLCVLTNCRLEW